MPEIITIGAYWGYTAEQCDGCPHLEHSLPMKDGETWVACDAPDYTCVKDGRVVYPNLKHRKVKE